MDVSTDLIRTFVAVCRERSFSAAAQKLGKAQSTVSLQITVLEREVDSTLLDRSQRPIALTDAGRIFFEFAVEQLDRTSAVGEALKELAAGKSGRARIGASTPVATQFLSSVLARVQGSAPGITFEITVRSRGTIFDLVKTERV